MLLSPNLFLSLHDLFLILNLIQIRIRSLSEFGIGNDFSCDKKLRKEGMQICMCERKEDANSWCPPL